MKKSLSQHSKYGTRFWRAALLVVLSLTTPGSSPASSNPIPNDHLVALPLWSHAFEGEEKRNIEKYAIAQIQPSYPVAAERYRIQGSVTVQVTVNKDGKVLKADFVRGHTVFRYVSLDAAKQWQFESPNDKDIESTIDFTFKLK
jgi:TonB family protein